MRRHHIWWSIGGAVAILLAFEVVSSIFGKLPLPGDAAIQTGTFNATITIQSSCQIISSNPLSFGTQGVLTANSDSTATFTVQCTNTTPYNVGLNAGSTTGGTVTTRLMAAGGATVAYKMYSDAGRTTNWGNTVGTDAVAGTGTGSTQTLTIYGRVPTQSTPRPATYTDTVTLTITY
jgi:spore coat protein U-like protein